MHNLASLPTVNDCKHGTLFNLNPWWVRYLESRLCPSVTQLTQNHKTGMKWNAYWVFIVIWIPLLQSSYIYGTVCLLPEACSCSGVAQGSSVWGSSCPWCGIWKWLPHCLHGTHGISSKEQFYTWSSKQISLHFTFIIPNPIRELPGYHPFSVNVNQLVTSYTYIHRCNICIHSLGTTQHNQVSDKVYSSSLCSQSVK